MGVCNCKQVSYLSRPMLTDGVDGLHRTNSVGVATYARYIQIHARHVWMYRAKESPEELARTAPRSSA